MRTIKKSANAIFTPLSIWNQPNAGWNGTMLSLRRKVRPSELNCGPRFSTWCPDFHFTGLSLVHISQPFGYSAIWLAKVSSDLSIYSPVRLGKSYHQNKIWMHLASIKLGSSCTISLGVFSSHNHSKLLILAISYLTAAAISDLRNSNFLFEWPTKATPNWPF